MVRDCCYRKIGITIGIFRREYKYHHPKTETCIMKKLVSLFLIVLSMMFVGNVLAEGTNLKFAIGEWEPYTGEKIANSGMAAEIVSAACTAVGLKAEYEFFPWKRAENNVLVGSNLATFPYKEIQERMANYSFSDTLFSSSFGILMLKKNTNTTNFKYSKLEDFTNHPVGIVSGTDAIRIPLEKAGIKVEGIPTVDQNIKKLEAGRIDFYIDDKAVIYQALKKNYTAEQMAEFVFSETDFGEKNDFKIMISLKYPDSKVLTGKINEGLKKIKESGEHKKILEKYGL
jgi:polar amino acid transport system substrate-binding protein